MEGRINGRPLQSDRATWKNLFTWQTLMAVFVVCEMLALCTRHYDPLYFDRLWPRIGVPLTTGFAAIVLSRADMRRRPGMLWMVLYFFWYCAVLVVNRWFLAYEWADFQLVLNRLLFTTLVCYPLGCMLAEAARRRMARAVFCALTGAVAVMGAIGFFCVVFQTHWYTPYMHGAVGLGFEGKTGLRLYLFAHPNISGAVLMMALLLCVYLWLTSGRRAAKAWHGVCCLFLFLALALTVSRVSMLAASVGISLLPFLWVRDRVRPSRPRLALWAGLACACLAAAVCYAGLNLVVWGTGELVGMTGAPGSSSAAEMPVEGEIPPALDTEEAVAETSDASAENPAEPAAERPVQRDPLTDLDSFGGRLRIWNAALRVVSANPRVLIKGTTLERLMLLVNEQAPERQGRRGYVHLHNAYLPVLIGMGLPAFLLLLCFLSMLARRSFHLIFRAGTAGLGERFLPAIVLGSLIMGITEPFYFTGQYFADRLFYLMAGFIAATACGKSDSARS